MIQDRNFTSHEYDEAAAEVVYQRVRDQYYPEMNRTFTLLREKFGSAKRS